MKTCANHVDEMEHYPVQGAMGLKEMNAQELAEFKGFRSELGELPGPTVEELATIPASYDLRTKWPRSPKSCRLTAPAAAHRHDE